MASPVEAVVSKVAAATPVKGSAGESVAVVPGKALLRSKAGTHVPASIK